MADGPHQNRSDDHAPVLTARAATLPVAPPLGPVRRAAGFVALGVSLAATVPWLVWRFGCLDWNPVKWVVLTVELVGLLSGAAIAIALLRSDDRRAVLDDRTFGHRSESNRFANAVADLVGRTRSHDLHRDVRVAVRAASRWRPRSWADVAMAAVLFEGVRRLALVLLVSAGLLLGVPPMPVPPRWALAALALALAAISVSHVAAGNGRIRFGDRTRWTYGAIGEILSPVDHAALAPRRWVGTVAAAVLPLLAVGLRGMSDRWTHGLAPMGADVRMGTMLLAVAVSAGAFYTLASTPVPDLPDAHLAIRRLEERTARQAALGTAVVVGAIGLVAGAASDGSEPVREDVVVELHDAEPVDAGLPPGDAGDADDRGDG